MREMPAAYRSITDAMSRAVDKLETVFPYAQALFSEQDGVFVGISGRETNIGANPRRRGVVLSVFNGSHSVEMATSDLAAASLESLTKDMIATISVEKSGREACLPGDAWEGSFFSTLKEDPRTVPLKDKLDHLSGIREFLASQSSRVVSSMVRYSERITRKIYVNRNKRLFQELFQTACIPVVIVSDGKVSKSFHDGHGGQAGFEITRIPEVELVKIVENAERLLGAKPVKPGVYDVVGGPGLAGVIAHEAFGHGVESDMFLKERAKAVEFVDREVASPIVSLYDSPVYPDLSGSYFFDDEGMKASETEIIRDGVLRQVLTDQRSAHLLGLPRTANGRRESYANKVYTRMSNTYFAPGKYSLDDLISSVDSGLYMPEGSNGMEDPKGWGIQVESPFAIEIKNGKLTDQVFSPVVITGFVPELLKSITMTSSNLGFMGLGICQKGHKEQVSVAIGGPEMKMKARVG